MIVKSEFPEKTIKSIKNLDLKRNEIFSSILFFCIEIEKKLKRNSNIPKTKKNLVIPLTPTYNSRCCFETHPITFLS